MQEIEELKQISAQYQVMEAVSYTHLFSRVDRKHDDADDHRDHHGTYDGMYRFARPEYR